MPQKRRSTRRYSRPSPTRRCDCGEARSGRVNRGHHRRNRAHLHLVAARRQTHRTVPLSDNRLRANRRTALGLVGVRAETETGDNRMHSMSVREITRLQQLPMPRNRLTNCPPKSAHKRPRCRHWCPLSLHVRGVFFWLVRRVCRPFARARRGATKRLDFSPLPVATNNAVGLTRHTDSQKRRVRRIVRAPELRAARSGSWLALFVV